MGLERRGRIRRSHDRSNWKQEDLDACDRQAVWSACLPDGSRVRRESHARFCERPVVKFRRPTQPFLPGDQGISDKAPTAIRAEVRNWSLPQRTDKAIEVRVGPLLRALLSLARRCDNWTVTGSPGRAEIHTRKLRGYPRRTTRRIARISRRAPGMFAHWQMGVRHGFPHRRLKLRDGGVFGRPPEALSSTAWAEGPDHCRSIACRGG